MKFINLLILLVGLSIILNSCSTFGDVGKAMRNEKRTTTDEFLIKNKKPLIQPPDFGEIPLPGSVANKTEVENDGIKKILRNNKTPSSRNQSKSSSTEKSILNQIKK